MPRDQGFVARMTPDKATLYPMKAFPPPDLVEVVPVGRADHMRAGDPVLWLRHQGRSRCYPWWAADNYHMINDVVGDSPIWVAF